MSHLHQFFVSLFRLHLARAFAMEFVTQEPECLFLRHGISVVIHILQLHVGFVA